MAAKTRVAPEKLTQRTSLGKVRAPMRMLLRGMVALVFTIAAYRVWLWLTRRSWRRPQGHCMMEARPNTLAAQDAHREIAADEPHSSDFRPELRINAIVLAAGRDTDGARRARYAVILRVLADAAPPDR